MIQTKEELIENLKRIENEYILLGASFFEVKASVQGIMEKKKSLNLLQETTSRLKKEKLQIIREGMPIFNSTTDKESRKQIIDLANSVDNQTKILADIIKQSIFSF